MMSESLPVARSCTNLPLIYYMCRDSFGLRGTSPHFGKKSLKIKGVGVAETKDRNWTIVMLLAYINLTQ